MNQHSNRRGSLIVEVVIALVLLATATVALTRLAKSAAALEQQSNHRLTATLAAENTIQRLQGVPVENLSDQSARVAELVGQDAGCEIDVSTEPFTAGDRQGVHLRVDARISPAIRIRLHDWRFDSDSGSGSEDSTEKPAESDDA